MGGFITFIVLLLVGLIFGKINEMNHFRRLERDEAALAHIDIYNIKRPPEALQQGGALVNGNVVIAVDYFKVIASTLKMIVGGRLNSYQSLLTRARREAIIRMKKEAEKLGADAIYNARIEFSNVGQQPSGGGVELLAYGTAVKRP